MSMEKVKALRDMTGAGMMDCKKALDESSGNIDQAVDWLRKKGMASAGKKAGNITAEGLVGSMIHDNRAVILEVNCETDFVSRNKDFQDLIIDMMKVASSGDISDIKDLGNAKYDNEKTISEKVTSLISVIGENINPRRYKKIEITDGVLVSYTHNKMTDNLGSIGVILAIESSFEGKDELKALGHQIAMHIAASSPLAINVDGLSQDSIDRERKLATDMAQQSGKPDNIIEKMVEGRMKNFYKESALMDQVFVFDSKKQIKDIIADFEKEKNCKILISDFVYFKVGEGVEKKENNFAKEVMEQIG